MNLYDRYLLPYLIDMACGIRAVQRQRAKVVPHAAGRVLEIGIGTGRNLPYYDKEKLDALYGLDPAEGMHRLARKRMRKYAIDVRFLTLSGKEITPVWKRLAGGCHLDRDIPTLLGQGGFRITELETHYLPGPRPLTFNYRGTAVPA